MKKFITLNKYGELYIEKYYLKHIFRLYLPVKMKIMIFLYACAANAMKMDVSG